MATKFNHKKAISDALRTVLQELADYKGISLEAYLKILSDEDLDRIESRMNDPIIGALAGYSTGEHDVSVRADDILHQLRFPDENE